MIIGICGNIGSGKSTLADIISEDLSKKGVTVVRYSMADPVKYIAFKLFGFVKGKEFEYDPNWTVDYIVDGFIKILYESYNIKFYNIYNQNEYLKTAVKDIIYDDAKVLLDYFKEDNPDKGRKALQYIGTEFGRKLLNTIWIDIFLNTYNILSSIRGICVIIDDIRFINEVEIIKNKLPGEMIAIYCQASPEIASQRLNMDIELYKSQLKHLSEQEINKIPVDISFNNNTLNKNDLKESYLNIKNHFSDSNENLISGFSLNGVKYGIYRT